jgi:hypothetical protein
MSIWTEEFKMLEGFKHADYDSETHYKRQLEQLANYLLIKDKPLLEIATYNVNGKIGSLKWPNKGEIIAGSFVASTISKSLKLQDWKAKDIDIFFKSEADALEFAKINNLFLRPTGNPMCVYTTYGDEIVNLIYGVKFESPDELISNFDIRAISTAFDPNTNKIYEVVGAAYDSNVKRIVYNPVPRSASIRRLVKYVEKGFSIDKHQRLFFAQLISSELFSPEIELQTGY